MFAFFELIVYLPPIGDDVNLVHAEMTRIVTALNDDWEMVLDLKRAHQRSYMNYVSDLLRDRVESADDNSVGLSVGEKISEAFLGLDNDMSKEAIENAGEDEVSLMTSTVALSGAVAVLAHIDGPMLNIASCGDCVAVLGKVSQTGKIFREIDFHFDSFHVYFIKQCNFGNED